MRKQRKKQMYDSVEPVSKDLEKRLKTFSVTRVHYPRVGSGTWFVPISIWKVSVFKPNFAGKQKIDQIG